jgi:predicted acylesterase/phospholipase RssA
MVISGGAFTGLTYYGAIRELSRQNYWKIENIKTIHGTSIGSFISVLIALNYDWDVIDDYFIKRPWQHLFKTTTLFMIESLISKMGIYTTKIFDDTFQPLFAGKDIPLDITMKQFYELNGIELHMYTTDLNTFQTINISYKTHPDWRVVDAIYCSSCLPIIFTPFLFEGAAYADGGLYSNYPLQQCLEEADDPLEILGVYRILPKNKTKIIHGSTIIDYLSVLLNKILERILICQQTSTVGIECALPGITTEYSIVREILTNPEERKKYMDVGASYVKP